MLTLLPPLASSEKEASSAGRKPCAASKGESGANERRRRVAPGATVVLSSPPGNTPSPCQARAPKAFGAAPLSAIIKDPAPTGVKKSPYLGGFKVRRSQSNEEEERTWFPVYAGS